MLFIASFFILQLSSMAAAQTPGDSPVFRTGVADVRVDVQVTEHKRPVMDLAAGDFIVTDNGAPEPIVYFGREREPLALALLLDVSGSMRKNLERMAATAKKALGYLTPGDRVAILIFGRRSKVHLPLTDNRAEAASAIASAMEDQSVGSGTNINPAVLDAANYLDEKAEPRWRRAILMVTDNLGLNYRSPDDVVIGRLLSADVVFNAIVVGRGIRPGPRRIGQYENPDFTPADVFKFAEWTGGEATKASGPVPFTEMIERIRERYTLEYHEPEAKPREFRRITVNLTPAARARHPEAEVHARNGYYAAAQATATKP
ncbi:MAG: VWA domain-containing protein [Bryobacteraceae bacterium]